MSQLNASSYANDNHGHTSGPAHAQSQLPPELLPFIDLLARQAVREFVATNDNDTQRVHVACAR
ncbi:hypothetical protein ACTVH1_09780 [Gluconobacter cerinus]